jgi:hypothetical protein
MAAVVRGRPVAYRILHVGGGRSPGALRRAGRSHRRRIDGSRGRPASRLGASRRKRSLRVGHHPMVPAEAPFEAVQLDAHDRYRSSAEQPPPLVDARFTLKVSAHHETESAKFVCLLLLHVVVVEERGLDVQFRDECVHPLIGGTNNDRTVLLGPPGYADAVEPRSISGCCIFNGEVPVELLRNDPVEHGFDVDGHDDSLAGGSSP